MKTRIIIMLSVFCVSCNGQNTQYKGSNKSATEIISNDTVSVLSLRNKQYGNVNYTILRLYNLDNHGNRIDSTNRIELTKDNKIVASIFLPNSEDVKNFSVSKIAEIESGFKIVTNWGGGNYFYGREFYFTFKDSHFFLDSIEMSSYKQEPEKETRTIKKLDNPIPIEHLDILDYLVNK